MANVLDPEHVLVHVDLPIRNVWQDPVTLEALGPKRWEVWRQDDNGNRAVIQTFRSKAAAECLVEAFEAKHHKQTYWIHDGTTTDA
jgi:hypothetical protein